MLPLASRMPVSMASLLRSDSVNPFRNSSNYKENADKFNACLSLKNSLPLKKFLSRHVENNLLSKSNPGLPHIKSLYFELLWTVKSFKMFVSAIN